MPAKTTPQAPAPKKSQKGRVAAKDHVTYRGKKFTPKQALFIRKYVEGLNGTQAAMVAYNTDERNARAMAAENLAKPSIREAVDAALTKLNITPEKAIEPIHQALNYQDDEDAKATIEMRLKGSDRALKLMGATQESQPPSAPSVHLHMHSKRDDYGL